MMNENGITESNTVAPRIVRFIGKCRCKKLHRVEGVMSIEPRFKKTARINDFEAYVWKGKWRVSVKCYCNGGAICRLVQLDKVFAAAVTTHECGARCRNATGPACECSCKGKNHGVG